MSLEARMGDAEPSAARSPFETVVSILQAVGSDRSSMDRVAFASTSHLTEANGLDIQGLKANVTATQRWGVCDPPLPTSTFTAVKNGWGPHSGGYRLNSIGYVNGNGRLYILAISTRSPNGFSYGLTTINRVSTMVYM